MNFEYKAFVLLSKGPGPSNSGNLGELNKLLVDGWIPIRETPAQSGGEYGFMTWLIVLEREIVLEVVEPENKPTVIDQLQGVLDKAYSQEMDDEDFLAQLRKM